MKFRHVGALALAGWPLVLIAVGLLCCGIGAALYTAFDNDDGQSVKMSVYFLFMVGLLAMTVAMIALAN